MVEVFKCPICLGRGHVRKSFYESAVPDGTITTSSSTFSVNDWINVPCKSCEGKGIIILNADGENYVHHWKVGDKL